MITPPPTSNPVAVFAAMVALVATLVTTTVTASEELEPPLVQTTLVADVHSIEPGVPFHLGVRFDIMEAWHINWINPGDAGLAPSIDWQLPDGFDVEHMAWPHPGRHPAGPLVIFGYEGSVTLWTTATPPESLRPGQDVELRAAVDWLACEESCVPGQSETALTLPVETAARIDTASVRSFQKTQRTVPVASRGWNLAAHYGADEVVLMIDAVAPLTGPAPAGVFFFPDSPGIIENAEPQRLEIAANGVRLSITRSRMGSTTPARITGVLVSQTGWGADGPAALRVDVPLEPR